ncbi:MAG: CehA/McbA family metallohydrolase [Actinomycetota bacterium]
MRNRVTLIVGIVAVMASILPRPALGERARDCEWLAGDFHVHTIYSHDSWSGPGTDDPNGNDPFGSLPGDPEEFFSDAITLGQTVAEDRDLALSRGLDFIAITDHDNVMAQQDPAYGTGDLIWVPDMEYNSPAAGHAQMHGTTHGPDHYTGTTPQVAEQLRAEGGAFQINHPSDGDWHDFNDANGDGQAQFDEFTYKFPGFAPDSLEVWNIGVWLYEPPFPATNDHEWAPQMYDSFLNQGFRVAATGGSDSHWKSTSAVQGVGQPTTWVCAPSSDAAGVIQGLKANRTTISNEPPTYQGPFAYLEADSDGDGNFEAMIGDTVLPGSDVRVVVERAPGAIVRLVTNSGTSLPDRDVASADFATTFEVPEDATWARAEVFYRDAQEIRREFADWCEMSNTLFGSDPDSRNTYCENRIAMQAMTSPIYFAAADFDPMTTLVYVGDTQARVGSDATLAATLTDSSGTPLPGQLVTFALGDRVLEATTDESGRATVTTRVAGPPRDEIVHVTFAGTDVYAPAHVEAPLSITTGK